MKTFNHIVFGGLYGIWSLLSSLVLLGCVTQYDNDLLQSIINLEQEEATIKKVPLADPFILIHDGVYYAYGTSSASSGFYVYISQDLVKWQKYPKYVLHKDDVIGNWGFWAPEVYKFKDNYYMYYTAEISNFLAVSDNPLGPFTKDHVKLTDNCCLDGTVFEADGNTYYYYVNRIEEKYYIIYVSKMNPDKKSLKKDTSVECIRVSQRWEEDNVNEGPTVVKVGSKYIMTYSACGCTSPNYGIGVAVADDPMGPWTKYEGNPVMQYPIYKGMVLQGTGHNSLFKDLDGNWRMVFHAHSAKGYEGGRYMYIVSVDLLDHPPYIVFHDDLFAPVIADEESTGGSASTN